MIQHPRIGIRPTIDGRRQGPRTLEVQTMNMAKVLRTCFLVH